ncbi:MAG TPA: hypothetical protein PLH57_04510 [Oligoflexia bacterium]|nr:hypothetical protein [Oligoflexia bacterium]
MSDQTNKQTENVISLNSFRSLQSLREKAKPYRQRIEQMDKAGLLIELIHYDELYKKNPNDVSFTIRAEQLMEVLEARAELTELRELARELHGKLRSRLHSQLSQAK